jgi:hypothetical protein
MRKTTVAITLAAAAAASIARADVALDANAGAVHAVRIEGSRAVDTAWAADGKVTLGEIVSPASLPILAVDHTAAGLSVHAGAGGTGPVTTALFQAGIADGTSNTILLRELQSGVVRRPSAVRTIAIDPADPGAEYLDGGHVALRDGAVRAWILARRSSGAALLLDYDVAGGPVRRVPLGYTPPIGSNKGSLVALANGKVWGAFESGHTVSLFEDLLISSVVAPTPRATLSLGPDLVPGSTRLGIIAILIGLLAQPTPVLSYQVGNELVVAVPENGGFRTIARRAAPANATALIEEEGIFYYLLPYLEQDNLFKAYGSAFGQEPAVLFTTGRCERPLTRIPGTLRQDRAFPPSNRGPPERWRSRWPSS